MDEGLGRDAAHVEADAPQPLPLDQGHGAPGGRGPQGGGVPARAPADDQQVDPGGDLADDHLVPGPEQLGEQGDGIGQEAGDVLGEGRGQVAVDQAVVGGQRPRQGGPGPDLAVDDDRRGAGWRRSP